MRDLSLNDRVRQALSEAGLTQAELASAIRSTPDKLSKSLGGARRFTSTELARIAKTTGRSMEWLLSGAEASSPAFAGRVTGSVAQTTHVETAARFENADSSLRSLGYTHALPALPTIEKTPMFVAHGTKLAAWARQQIEASVSSSTMGLADQVEESFGVDVAQVDMPDGVHGFTWQTENFRLICLATTQNWARQRFTLAHELGHILSGDAHEGLVEESEGDRTHYFSEKAANSFAGAFLMPKGIIENAWAAQTGDVRDRAARVSWALGVSPAALASRLRKLSLITPEHQDDIAHLSTSAAARMIGQQKAFEELGQASSRVSVPRRLLSDYRHAFEAGRVSARPLARLTGLPVDEFLQQADARPGAQELDELLDDGEI